MVVYKRKKEALKCLEKMEIVMILKVTIVPPQSFGWCND